MVSLERPRDRAVLGHWPLKDAALRVSVLRITEKDSERSPDSAPPLLIAISLLVRTRQAWLVRNPAQSHWRDGCSVNGRPIVQVTPRAGT